MGQGETIVFFEVDGYSQRDLSTYAATFGLPAFADPLPHIGPLDLKPEGESEMDLEVAHSIAPGAKLVYVNLDAFGGGGSSPVPQFEQAFSTVSTRYPGAIWSISLGQCEMLFGGTDLSTVDQTVAGAERAGSTVFAASGDSGGLECLAANQSDPQIPAEGISSRPTCPVSPASEVRRWTSPGRAATLTEAAWTEPLLSQGSTGGQSVFFTQPSWQRGPGCGQLLLGPGGLLGPGRDLLPARCPTWLLTPTRRRAPPSASRDGGWGAGGRPWRRQCGPRFCALIDEYLRGKGDSPVGFANPLLYQLASAQSPYSPFHQVTLGANDFYPAGPGYNMVTGLGTPDVWDIARDLAAYGRKV